jgi:hypothetical protein
MKGAHFVKRIQSKIARQLHPKGQDRKQHASVKESVRQLVDILSGGGYSKAKADLSKLGPDWTHPTREQVTKYLVLDWLSRHADSLNNVGALASLFSVIPLGLGVAVTGNPALALSAPLVMAAGPLTAKLLAPGNDYFVQKKTEFLGQNWRDTFEGTLSPEEARDRP